MIQRLTGKGKMKLAYLVALVVALVASTTINVSHSEAGGVLVQSGSLTINVSGSALNYESTVLYQGQLPQGQTYGRIIPSENFSVYPDGPHTKYWHASVNVLVSTDGVNWKSGGTLAYKTGSGYSEGGYVDLTRFSERYRYIRIVLTTADPGATGGARASGQVTIQFYSVAADQETVEEARDAAIQARDNTQAAVDAARQAQQAAEEVNTIVNSTLTVSAGVVQDANGTVLTAARAAQMAAQANSQKLDNISNALNQMQSNIQQVQQSVQNITQNMPPILNRIAGLNGANATSSGSLQVIVDAANVTQYRYRIDNGGWSAWLPFSDNVVTVPIPRGVHTLTIQVANGPVGTPGPAASASMQVIGL